jgi:hypothetical protein
VQAIAHPAPVQTLRNFERLRISAGVQLAHQQKRSAENLQLYLKDI